MGVAAKCGEFTWQVERTLSQSLTLQYDLRYGRATRPPVARPQPP